MKSQIKRSAISAFLALLMTITCLTPCVYASNSEIGLVASYSSPALCTDVGNKVTFADCSVQYTFSGEVITGDKITWTMNGKEVTDFTPDKAGVTPVTAVCGENSREVYVVAKNAADTEYVLYFNDFTGDPTEDLRVIQQTSGTKIRHDAAEGTLVLDASNDGNGYIRVLFPEYLDNFGDAVYSARLKLSDPQGSNGRYGALIYRLHNNDIPYMQAAIRYDSTTSNGVEIARRTEENKWSVVQKGSAGETKDKFTDLCVDAVGSATTYSVNGKIVLTDNATPYKEGAMGLHIRGAKMTVDSVKITVNPVSSLQGNIIPGSFATVRDVVSNISSAPVIISEITDEEQYNKLTENAPAVAIFTLVANEMGTQIVLGFDSNGIIGTGIEDVLKKLDGKIIPAFRVASEAAADALSAYAKENDLRDMYVVSDDAALVARAWRAWNYLRGVVDFSSYSGSDFENIRSFAMSSGARVVILPTYSMNKENVTYLQDRYIVAWANVGSTAADNVKAINCGVLGVITEDRAVTEECFTKYYEKNTLTSTPNIIGHRGVPTLAQENSLAGGKKAFELGATMVENDIYLSADGVLVVMHDATIDRTTNGSGEITSMTLKDLEKYRIDVNKDVSEEPIPTLEDYFKEFKDNGKVIVIEIKQNSTSLAKPLAELIKKYDIMKQVVVITFSADVVKAVREEMPGISMAYLNSSIKPEEDNAMAYVHQYLETIQTYNTACSPSYASGAIGKNIVTELLRRGTTTWVWTVNNPADFDKCFTMGIRGITTNYSQWGDNYVRFLDIAVGANGKYTLNAIKYNNKEEDVTSKAKLVVVDDGGTGVGFDSATGKFTFAEGAAGTAKVFFTHTVKTTEGTEYNLVTELITVSCEPGVPVISGDTGTDTGSTPGTGNAVPGSDTDGDTLNANVSNDSAASSEDVGDKGCGSVVSAVCGLTFAVCAAFAVKRRREDN